MYHTSLLGSHLSASGSLNDDLELHMTKRYVAVHKFYNFLRSDKLAPLSVKLTVLRACVTTALLHNCEAFGPKIPKNLESTYFSLVKACMGIRSSAPNMLALVESGMPTLESMIYDSSASSPNMSATSSKTQHGRSCSIQSSNLVAISCCITQTY